MIKQCQILTVDVTMNTLVTIDEQEMALNSAAT